MRNKKYRFLSLDTENSIHDADTQQLNNGDQFVLPYGAEMVPKQTLIQLESKSETGNPIFVIHGMDGNVSSVKTLAQKFNRPVWGVQCIEEAPSQNCVQLAEYYINEIKRVQSTGPYTVMGYSYGTLIAFEIAVALENSKETVKLYMIDGSPEFVTFYEHRIVERVDDIGDSHHIYLKSLAYFASRLSDTVTFAEVMELSISLTIQIITSNDINSL